MRQKRERTLFALYPDIEKVVVYGSRALGNCKEGSDIDLTIVGKALHRKKLNRIILALDDLMPPWQIDLSLFHDIDNAELVDQYKESDAISTSKAKEWKHRGYIDRAAGCSLSSRQEISKNLKRAGIAQSVEHQLPKLGAAGSNPVSRSTVHGASDRGKDRMFRRFEF